MKYEIHVGEECRDYRGGDLLNVIDEMVCYFNRNCDFDNDHIADILELYAGKLRLE